MKGKIYYAHLSGVTLMNKSTKRTVQEGKHPFQLVCLDHSSSKKGGDLAALAYLFKRLNNFTQGTQKGFLWVKSMLRMLKHRIQYLWNLSAMTTTMSIWRTLCVQLLLFQTKAHKSRRTTISVPHLWSHRTKIYLIVMPPGYQVLGDKLIYCNVFGA